MPIALTRTLDRGLRLWAQVETAGAVLALSAMVALLLAQIALRALAAPLVWGEEAGVYLFFWLIFLAAPAAHKQFLHIRVGALDTAAPPIRKAALWLANLVVLVVSATLVWHAPAAMAMDSRSFTTSLPIDIARVWFFSGPLTYAMLSIAITSAVFLVTGIPDRSEYGEIPR